jgi:hypothetical protein
MDSSREGELARPKGPDRRVGLASQLPEEWVEAVVQRKCLMNFHTSTPNSIEKLGRLAKELIETAADIHRVGLLDRATYEKITMRHRHRHSADRARPA